MIIWKKTLRREIDEFCYMTASALLETVKLSLFILLQPAEIKSVYFLTLLPTLDVISLVFINKMWQLACYNQSDESCSHWSPWYLPHHTTVIWVSLLHGTGLLASFFFISLVSRMADGDCHTLSQCSVHTFWLKYKNEESKEQNSRGRLSERGETKICGRTGPSNTPARNVVHMSPSDMPWTVHNSTIYMSSRLAIAHMPTHGRMAK